MEKDKLIISKIQDRISQCRQGDYVTSTAFLDSHEQALAKSLVSQSGDVDLLLYGGYEDAERRILICMPHGYAEFTDLSQFFSVLRVEPLTSDRSLSHRDYLGSLMGLGIERKLIGDILVHSKNAKNDSGSRGASGANGAEVGAKHSASTAGTASGKHSKNGADIIILNDISDYLLKEYTKVGRTDVRCSLVPLSEIRLPERNVNILRDTVPSLRLDNVLGTAFKLSRSNAVTAIKSGLVSVDHVECLKPDAKLQEGSVIVLKGKGKAILKEVAGESKKGRTWVLIERFV